MVVGFCKPNMKIESIRLPYICEECGMEHMRMAVRGKDFEYATAGAPMKVDVPDPAECPKCKKVIAEPDFLVDKTFKFLELPPS
jgi:ribosomal protein L44E